MWKKALVFFSLLAPFFADLGIFSRQEKWWALANQNVNKYSINTYFDARLPALVEVIYKSAFQKDPSIGTYSVRWWGKAFSTRTRGQSYRKRIQTLKSVGEGHSWKVSRFHLSLGALTFLISLHWVSTDSHRFPTNCSYRGRQRYRTVASKSRKKRKNMGVYSFRSARPHIVAHVHVLYEGNKLRSSLSGKAIGAQNV